ncbi:MAG: putative ABC transporter permease [Candidatus Nomurabacteria bacterium]|nr:putative ABC transporter permease [Candidatus Nomurabacteria bacterium]
MINVDLSHLFLYFFAYAILGYIWEMINQFIVTGKWRNRGFLYGPYQPIYGITAIILLPIINSVINNPLLVFITIASVATIIELITAVILDKLGFKRLWDYRDSVFEVVRKTTRKGYISPLISICWGLAALPFVYFAQPVFERFADNLLSWFGLPLIIILAAGLATDLVLSISFKRNREKPESGAKK